MFEILNSWKGFGGESVHHIQIKVKLLGFEVLAGVVVF